MPIALSDEHRELAEIREGSVEVADLLPAGKIGVTDQDSGDEHRQKARAM